MRLHTTTHPSSRAEGVAIQGPPGLLCEPLDRHASLAMTQL